jgi:hypothetical protein
MGYRSLCVGIAALGLALPVMADWDPSDGHKMHFPQLPNPTGWDVKATTPLILADDWLCTQTGPVLDIHFWGSWLGGIAGQVQSFNLSIHADTPDPDGPGPLFSMPGPLLWDRTVTPVITPPIDPPGQQGWYDPSTGFFNPNDHDPYFQYNIQIPVGEAFVQTQGTVYWLDVSATLVPGPIPTQWGWKTSLNHWNDDAVWSPGPGGPWQELRDPVNNESLDLAFVITPEPGTWGLIAGLGLVAFAGSRRHRHG